MTKKEYENSKKTIETEIGYTKAYKEKSEITKLAGLMQIIDDDPLAKAVVTDNNGLACDMTNTSKAIEAYEELVGTGNCSSGVAGGFGSMIYYSQTCEFFDKNKDLILKALNEEAKDLSCANELDFIDKHLKHWLNEWGNDNFKITLQDITQISNEKGECEDFKHTNLKNTLSWFAGQKIVNDFERLIESDDIRPVYLQSAETKMNEYVDKRVNRLNNDLKKLKKDFEKSNANTMSM